MIPLSYLSFVQCEQVKFRPKKKVKITVSHRVVAVGTVDTLLSFNFLFNLFCFSSLCQSRLLNFLNIK